ncbi:MAG TPA: hypothetical protein PKD54_16095 [Pirellulaceae bacterium]|nr:hypothetical protein [Pirellulaceae bacterium]
MLRLRSGVEIAMDLGGRIVGIAQTALRYCRVDNKRPDGTPALA